MLNELDDNDLYLLYKEQPAGDGQRAFAILVERYRPILASYMRKTLKVGDPATRDDIAQDVFVKLAGVADKFNADTSSVASWMFWLAKRQLKSI